MASYFLANVLPAQTPANAKTPQKRMLPLVLVPGPPRRRSTESRPCDPRDPSVTLKDYLLSGATAVVLGRPALYNVACCVVIYHPLSSSGFAQCSAMTA
jgi:hypothetical protein